MKEEEASTSLLLSACDLQGKLPNISSSSSSKGSLQTNNNNNDNNNATCKNAQESVAKFSNDQLTMMEPRDFQKCQNSAEGGGPESLSSNSSHNSNHSHSQYQLLSNGDDTNVTTTICDEDETLSKEEVNNTKKPTTVNEDTVSLQGALASLQQKLTQKDKEIEKLSKIREDLEAEMEDLTASLFEEAHKMVREANIKQRSAEKALAEADMKIDGLETEVAALKTLVLTSTPSNPNKHLHPQLNSSNKISKNKKANKDRSSTESVSSNHNNSSIGKKSGEKLLNGNVGEGGSKGEADSGKVVEHSEEEENSSFSRNFDPLLRKDYLAWKKSPTLDKQNPFIELIYKEDINLCLQFPNHSLASKVRDAVHLNSLCLSPIEDFSNLPRNCALLDAPVLCKYILKLMPIKEEEQTEEEIHHISQLARNRLAAVCDCVNYLRYVEKGLVKAPANAVYWEIMRLRKQMQVSRLGFSPEHN